MADNMSCESGEGRWYDKEEAERYVRRQLRIIQSEMDYLKKLIERHGIDLTNPPPKVTCSVCEGTGTRKFDSPNGMRGQFYCDGCDGTGLKPSY